MQNDTVEISSPKNNLRLSSYTGGNRANYLTLSESDFGYGQLFKILARQRYLVFGVMLISLIISGILTLSKSPIYQSSMQLLVEPNYKGEQDPEQLTRNTEPSDSDYATQINLMRSQQFFEEAANQLKSEYPDLTADSIRQSYTLSQLTENRTKTKIFRALFIGEDPIQSQQVLNVLQRIYLEYNLEQQKARLNRGVSLVNKQLQDVRENVIQNQINLQNFRENFNLINPEKLANDLTNSLMRIEKELQETQVSLNEIQTSGLGLQNQLNLTPQGSLVSSRLSQSPRFQFLLDELKKTDLEIARQQVLLTDINPKIQVLEEQRNNQLGLLRSEAYHVIGDVPQELDIEGDALLEQGHFGSIDLNLVAKLVDAQVNLSGLEARKNSLIQSRDELRAQINQMPRLIAEYDRLQPEIEIGREVVKSLLSQQQEISAQIVQGGFNWQVVEEPAIGRMIDPGHKRDIVLGLVVGLFLGCGAAFIREGLDDVIHSSDTLRRKFSQPFLGSAPEVIPSRQPGKISGMLSSSYESTLPSSLQLLNSSLFRDSIDLIYKNIQLNNFSENLRSLAITSAVMDEGKTTLVLALALSGARANKRILVIDADLRQPTIHQYLHISNNQGLSTVLTSSECEPKLVQVELCNLNFDVLTSGSIQSDPVRLLSSEKMSELIMNFADVYDLIFVDTPPILGMVDAIQTASLCDNSILVARLNKVTQYDLSQAVSILDKLNLVGIVANGSRNESIKYFQASQTINNYEMAST